MFFKQFFSEKLNTANSTVLVRGAAGSFAVKVIGAFVTFLLHVLLARLLGVSQYGTYAYVLALVNVVIVISMMGLNTSLVRFLAAYNAQGRWDLMRGFWLFSVKTLAMSSSIMVLLGLVAVRLFRGHLSSTEITAYYLGLFLIPVFSFVRLGEVGLRALKKTVRSELLIRILRPLFLMAIASVLFFLKGTCLNAIQAVLSDFAALSIVLSIALVWVIKGLPREVYNIKASFKRVEWIKVSIPLLLMTCMHTVLSQTDVIMSGAILGRSSVGVYAVVARIVFLVTLGLLAISTIIAPLISELFHTHKIEELQRLSTLATWGSFLSTLLVGVALGMFGRYTLSLFGEEFQIGFWPLQILLAGRIISSMAGISDFMMTMTGYQNQAGLIMATCALMNVILNAVLIPRIGLVGAAVSTATMMILWKFTMAFYVRRKLGITMTIFSKV